MARLSRAGSAYPPERGITAMQCYKYEALCRTLVACVKERYPGMKFDIHDAAEAIDDYGIEDVTQIADMVSIARNIGFGIRLAA